MKRGWGRHLAARRGSARRLDRRAGGSADGDARERSHGAALADPRGDGGGRRGLVSGRHAIREAGHDRAHQSVRPPDVPGLEGIPRGRPPPADRGRGRRPSTRSRSRTSSASTRPCRAAGARAGAQARGRSHGRARAHACEKLDAELRRCANERRRRIETNPSAAAWRSSTGSPSPGIRTAIRRSASSRISAASRWRTSRPTTASASRPRTR